MVDFRDLFGDMTPPVLRAQPVIVAPPPAGWTVDPPETAGTVADPFHSLTTAFERTKGRTIALRGGTYNEDVHATSFSGSEKHRIVIQPYQHESVTIDCYVDFLSKPKDEDHGHWDLVQHGSAVREFIWSEPFPAGEAEEVARGAFLETHAHTRLVTYDHLEDLLSANEFDPRIEDPRTPDEIPLGVDPPGDNHVWVVDNKKKVPTKNPSKYRNWVYMGPGLWFDADPHVRQLHLRLDHTHHNIPGWPDYTGITDPHGVKLALSKELTPTLFLIDCHYLVFKDLTLRFGGQETVRIKDCSNLEFDHVNVRAGSRAIRFNADKPAGNSSIVFHDCEIDGGMPTWFYRSDRKDEYKYVPATVRHATEDMVKDNLLGKSTTAPLISTAKPATDIEIHHCEIFNGHDLCMFGHNMRFHHNWINNINDDALFMGSEDADTQDALIYRNVITQVLTALSFGSEFPLGQIRIFRNLIDLREPTLGIRPGQRGDNPLRQGQFYKSNGLEGKIDWWHNTCLVMNAGTILAGFTHYRAFRDETGDAGRRRSYNNIFVAAYSDSAVTKPIAFLPPGDFSGPTDGNLYERVGPEDATDDSTDERKFAVTGDPRPFHDLGDYQDDYPWENAGIRLNPLFISFDHTTGQPHPEDDLRPQGKTAAHPDGSPAKGSAIPLADDEMTQIDQDTGGSLAKNFGKDRGCYFSLTFPFLGPVDRMSVGVGGRQKFPRLNPFTFDITGRSPRRGH
jgi:hypothetical protein